MSKTCSRCQQDKPKSEYRKNARYADGLVSWCNPCQKAYRAEHYQRNKARVKQQNAEWHAANKETRAAQAKANYEADKGRHAKRVAAAKARRPDHYRQLSAKRQRERRATEPEVAMRARISAQINYCLSTGKGGATSAELLGYSMGELRAHLERQFLPGMSWENKGEWHIDHIIPLASFDISGADDPELRRAWALPNLRPLWAKDNIRKGAKRETLV